MTTGIVLPTHADLPEVDPASSRGLRWRNRRGSWAPRSRGGFTATRYTVLPVDETTAKTYVTHNHYSGTFPVAVHRLGMFLDTGTGQDLVGVAVFGIPAQRKVLTNVFPDFEPYAASLELSRFVLESPHRPRPGAPLQDRAPSNSESWFLAQCLAYLATKGIRGVVSFADPVPRIVHGRLLFPGHHGTIYMASNAHYCGRTTARWIIVLPDGSSLSDRALQKVRAQERGHDYVERKLIALGARPLRAGTTPTSWLPDALNDIHATRLRHNGCRRFAMLTSRGHRKHARLGAPILPYPPREN